MSLCEENFNLNEIENADSFFDDSKQAEFSDISSIDNLELDLNIYDELKTQSQENIDEMPDNFINTPPKDEIKSKKKRTKEDLDKTPLPIFDCIYCCNDYVVFNHMIRQIICDKYLLNTSQIDLKKINNILSRRNMGENMDCDRSNQHLINFIIIHTEYLNKYYDSGVNKTVLSNLIKKNEDIYYPIVRRHKSKLAQNENTLTLTMTMFRTNIANPVRVDKFKYNSKNYVENCNKISPNFSNFYSNSLNFQKNEDDVINKNNHSSYPALNEPVTPAEVQVDKVININNYSNINLNDDVDNNQSFFKFLKFDLKRKIKKEDIIWEGVYQDIWNPNLSCDYFEIKEDLPVDKTILDKAEYFDKHLIQNSDENFSLQFSHNNSIIQNLFDTNFNFNNRSKDNVNKTINIVGVSSTHNASSDTVLPQYHNLLSFNSDIENRNEKSLSLIKLKQNIKKNDKLYSNKFLPPGLSSYRRLIDYGKICKSSTDQSKLFFLDSKHNFTNNTCDDFSLVEELSKKRNKEEIYNVNTVKNCNKLFKVNRFTHFSNFRSKYLSQPLAKTSLDKEFKSGQSYRKSNSNYYTDKCKNNHNNLSNNFLQTTKNSSNYLSSSFLSKTLSNNDLIKSFNLKNGSSSNFNFEVIKETDQYILNKKNIGKININLDKGQNIKKTKTNLIKPANKIIKAKINIDTVTTHNLNNVTPKGITNTKRNGIPINYSIIRNKNLSYSDHKKQILIDMRKSYDSICK